MFSLCNLGRWVIMSIISVKIILNLGQWLKRFRISKSGGHFVIGGGGGGGAGAGAVEMFVQFS